ncbi:MAG: hypothetical protein K9G69_07950 [Candidatus Nanopelagicales bacterium]|nr:hypothetical protein [Candidatus Nanopelagicales bacterium]
MHEGYACFNDFVVAIVIRNIGFFGMAGFSVLAALFIVGEWVADPVGVWGVAGPIVLGVLVVGTTIWAWVQPVTARIYMYAATAVIAVLSVWWGLAPQFWMNLMDDNGPVIPAAAIVVAVPLVAWGRREWATARRAGILLMVVAGAPIIGVAVSPPDVARGVLAAVAIMTGPYVVGGLLYVIASRQQVKGSQ